MLIPLTFPPGVYRNGTDLQSAGRWRDASCVRWAEGVMKPVGGWSARKDTSLDVAPRGALAWSDLAGDRRIAFGTFDGLYSMTAANVVSDITPAGLTSGLESSSVNVGYGGGPYGLGTYGTPRSDSGVYAPVTTWSFDTWGEDLIACSSSDGKIYEWGLNPAVLPTAITGAPTDNAAALVTEERFLFALGAGGDPRKVQWCDREDYSVWTPAATNEAGDMQLQTQGRIMQGLRARGQSLILTDLDAHAATYVGPPFVYGFERVGAACGVISSLAGVSVGGVAYWMGRKAFYRYAGGAVEEIACEVSDYVFPNLTESQKSKVWAVVNAGFHEVWWFYPQSAECDNYVVYNYRENHWTVGALSRTAGVDAGVFANPIWFDADAVLYDHETGAAYGGADVYAETGPISVGGNVVSVTDLIPDEATQGDVTVTFKTRFYPNDTETDHGPYTMAAPTSVRFQGRQIRMRVTGDALTSWRWGIPRIDVKEMGAR